MKKILVKCVENGTTTMTEFLSMCIMVFAVFMTGLLLGQAGKK